MQQPLSAEPISGHFQLVGPQEYQLQVGDRTWTLVTLHPTVDRHLQSYPQGKLLSGWGYINPSGQWLRLEGISS